MPPCWAACKVSMAASGVAAPCLQPQAPTPLLAAAPCRAEADLVWHEEAGHGVIFQYPEDLDLMDEAHSTPIST